MVPFIIVKAFTIWSLSSLSLVPFISSIMVIDIGLQQSDMKTANMVVSASPYSGHKAIVTGQIDLFATLLS
jgi:hypothetical protein